MIVHVPSSSASRNGRGGLALEPSPMPLGGAVPRLRRRPGPAAQMLAARIARARRARGHTQNALAAHLGRHATQISNWYSTGNP